jgi:uncharacterized phage-associated protein
VEGKLKNLKFTFDHRKGTQALNFFAIQEGGKINKLKALKLIFLADRYHLRKYGRLITNDSYVAMKHGPVPSVIKDIAESSDYLDDSTKEYAKSYVRPMSNLELASVKKIDMSIFSESDLEALQFAWDVFGRYDQFQLRDITHSYPEWIKHKKNVATGSCYPMNILDFLKDPTEEVDQNLELKSADHKTFGLDEEDRRVRSEALAERSLIESFWR